MDWLEKMYEGMNLMKEACHENKEWEKCKLCPFAKFCEALTDEGYDEPNFWEVYK